MGRAPCCDKANVKRGPWSPEEDAKLKDYIHSHGTGGNWIALPQKAGLKRCGKSCRLRWLNYLRPNIKHGEFSDEEDTIICTLFATIGSRWSIIAAQLPGRTDNDIKNYWNTKLKKKLMGMANNINPNPQIVLSHHTFKPNNTSFHPAVAIPHNHSPSPDSSLLLSPDNLSSSPFKTTSTGLYNYSNAPSSALIPLTGFDQGGFLINSPNGMMCPSAPTILQPDGYFCPSPMQNNYPLFGGAPETSCSSSDGNDLHRYQYQDQPQPQPLPQPQQFFHGCPPNNSSMGLVETAALMGYGLEEIKQLISTSTPQNGDYSYSNNNCFYLDENKTGEGVMMYY